MTKEEINEVVEAVVESCAQIIESISQARLPEIFRGCGLLNMPEDEEGWTDLSKPLKDFRNSLASLLRQRCQMKDERLFNIEIREKPQK